MKSYVWLTFAFLGWGYFEMSGGTDFEPEETPILIAAETAPVAEIVTRASSPALLAVPASNVPAPRTQADAEIVQAVAAAIALNAVEDAEVVQVAAPVAPPLDIRQVAGSRVNMRVGPSTDFEVITTLDGGTQLEVLDINAADWAHVRTVDTGVEGWMAQRLLTEPQG